MLEHVGFELRRVSGSHHIYRHKVKRELMVNLQASSGKAKPYQVRQVLDVIEANEMEVQ